MDAGFPWITKFDDRGRYPVAKYKVGDRVKVKGRGPGSVTEVAEHPKSYFADGNPQLYSVLLDPEHVAEKYPDRNGNEQVRYRHPKTGAVRDHQYDSLGCVPETDLG